ncbi:MAG TPA: imidazolonepropionase [Steroidobacteraceae bacterium]|jgi:imidazolonepropionase
MTDPEAAAAQLFTNARLLTMRADGHGVSRDCDSLAAIGGRISAIGNREQLQRLYPQAERIDLDGRLLTPGLIDCHTHIVYGGDRSSEMQRRLAGESYESIARAGGGILSTAAATARLTEEQLAQEALPRVDALMADGVTSLEIKSGYGLDLQSELRCLRAARRIGSLRPMSVSTTYLGAHVVPAHFPGGADGYVEQLCSHDLPAVAASGLADAVDAYCESIAFSGQQVERVLATARALGLARKLHADQLSNMHAAALAARYGALSADHLEYTDADGIAALKHAGTVAVILPGAFYFLRQRQAPPVAELRRAGVPMAVSTDCNPGTSPLCSLLIAMNLAAVQFGLSTDECLAGVTREAARALGVLADRGTLEVGKSCDLAVWDVEDPAALVHTLGARPLHLRVWRGYRAPATIRSTPPM